MRFWRRTAVVDFGVRHDEDDDYDKERPDLFMGGSSEARCSRAGVLRLLAVDQAEAPSPYRRVTGVTAPSLAEHRGPRRQRVQTARRGEEKHGAAVTGLSGVQVAGC